MENHHRISGAKAAYMELKGAKKDGDCSKVEVPGGISRDRGCCNLYSPQKDDTTVFDCGHCHHVCDKGKHALYELRAKR